MDVEFALQDLLTRLAEQNIHIEVRKVPDKELIYEVKMPDRVSSISKSFSQGPFARQMNDSSKVEEEERLSLQAQMLGVGQLETDKVKQKVRMQNQFKQVMLGLTGDRLLVRHGGGFLDFVEFLDRKGLIPRD